MKKTTAFSKLSKAEQRVEIAKDVIKQCSKGKYEIETGGYIDLYPEGLRSFDELEHLQANTCVSKGRITCTVCAKGALFMSHVMKTNHCLVKEADKTDDTGIKKRLKNIFSPLQLDLIETAFERSVVVDDTDKIHQGCDYTELGKKATNFGWQYSEPNERLIAIMKNIIKNKGTFKP